MLVADGMIDRVPNGGGATLTLLNYERYNAPLTSGIATGTSSGTPSERVEAATQAALSSPATPSAGIATGTPSGTKRRKGSEEEGMYKNLDLDAGDVAFVKDCVAAVNRGLMNNRRVLEIGAPQPLLAHWEGSLAAGHELRRSGMTVQFAIGYLCPAAMAYRPTSQHPQPTSLRYFVRGAIEAWQVRTKTEGDQAARAHLPEGVRPLPESQRRRKASPTPIGDIMANVFPKEKP
jgi:hypothetical protein